ncbi:MAG TPA: hypothetical protein PLP06_11695 [Saprospiraceae bacterium]|nr:hypothetical protein [Saprospiraceae bacterium]
MGIILPPGFIARMQVQLGAKYDDFVHSLEQPPPVSLRLNPRKVSTAIDFSLGSVVPWHPDAYYLDERPSFTGDPVFHAGGYYVQEASSMILGHIVSALEITYRQGLVIDLCAAPGGKSTDLLQVIPTEVTLISNEVISSRLGTLRQNLIRWGYPNVLVTGYPPANIAATGLKADLVVVDAPCSGEGLFRKDPQAVNHWTAALLQTCERRQVEILRSASEMVTEGGYLIYSTCTYNPGENLSMMENMGNEFECMEMDFPEEWSIQQVHQNGLIGYQFYPHRLRGEGFFISIFKRIKPLQVRYPFVARKVEWEGLSPTELSIIQSYFDTHTHHLVKVNNAIFALPADLSNVLTHIKVKPLFELGSLIRNEFVPAHGSAMLSGLDLKSDTIELTISQAIQYLRREPIVDLDVTNRGWYLVRYLGLNLGWIKNIGERINNYFPVDWRIMKLPRS